MHQIPVAVACPGCKRITRVTHRGVQAQPVIRCRCGRAFSCDPVTLRIVDSPVVAPGAGDEFLLD